MNKTLFETDFVRLLRGAEAFFLSLWDPSTGGFRFTPLQPPTLMATAYAVLGLEFLGRLSALSPAQEEAVVAFIMGGAQPDGSFRDSLFREEDIVSSEHDISYFHEETTTFCQQALDALLAPAPPPRKWPDDRRSSQGLISYFESFPWKNPWLDSNRVMFSLSQICHEAERYRKPELLTLVDGALDWLEDHQSSETGLWKGPHNVSLENALAATFHFTFFYAYRRRPLKHVEQIIDSCLSLQQSHGLFSGVMIGHTCLDYDAIDLLAKACLVTNHRREEVMHAIEDAAKALLHLRNAEDGGFANCRERSQPVYLGRKAHWVMRLGLRSFVTCEFRQPVDDDYSVCWRLLSCKNNESNALSTWFRLLALVLTGQGNSQNSTVPSTIVFRRLPFLGYHDLLGIQSAHTVVSSAPLVIDQDWTLPRERIQLRATPLISVIIPAYNASATLSETLSSLRSQTYPNWEAIVVNDGSSDQTGKKAERWAISDDRVMHVVQDNRGLGVARNTGLTKAKGDLVHCLDADDLIEPDFYEQVIGALSQESRAGNIGLCAFTRARHFTIGGRIIATPKTQSHDFTFSDFCRGNPGEPLRYVFEKNILLKTGVFDGELRHCHDWDLWIRFARIGIKFVPVNNARGWYRVSSESLSNNYVNFVNSAAELLRRATREDPRCERGIDQARPKTYEFVENCIAEFWYFNVLRAINKDEPEAATELFMWARQHLSPGIWSSPEALSIVQQCQWIDNPPTPDGAKDIGLSRRLMLVKLLLEFWPGLPQRTIKKVLLDYLWEAIDGLQDSWLVRQLFLKNLILFAKVGANDTRMLRLVMKILLGRTGTQLVTRCKRVTLGEM